MAAVTVNQLKAKLASVMETVREQFPNQHWIDPTLEVKSLGRKYGCCYFNRWHIELNADLLEAGGDHLLNVTVAHEVAHLVHWTFRPQDYQKGKRQGHGRWWKLFARRIGLDDATRCGESSDAVRAALGIKQPKRHRYECPICKTHAHAGPRQHAKIQRGNFRFRIIKCSHYLSAANYVGVATSEVEKV